MSRTEFQTVDEYIAAFPPETRARLEQVRATIRDVVPEATEKISYAMPAFSLYGRNLVYYAAFEHHIGLYGVFSAFEAHKDAVAPYLSGKSTLRFLHTKPLPLDLIGTLVADCAHASTARSSAKPRRGR
ncbi:MAG TPA: DUF1801 domain-containing protein [Dehalococcoidia bacterium]